MSTLEPEGPPVCECCGKTLDPQDMMLDTLLRIESLLEIALGVDSDSVDEERPGGQH